MTYSKHASTNGSGFGLPLQIACLAVLITWWSLELTGFKFGKNLNVFHIPYVMRFIDRPEFAADPFVLSLENFTTAVWPVIRALVDTFDARLTFLFAHVVVRFASVYTLLLLAQTCGLGLWGATISATLVATSMALMPDSPVGRHEMFLDYFTHSVVTWPLIFFTFRSLVARRFRSASVALALTFDINAFVALWMLAVAIFQRGEEFWRSSAKIKIQSIALFLLIVAPVAVWILSSIAHTGAATPFSYKQYIGEYFPDHFLVEAASRASLIRVGLYFLAAWFASGLLRDPGFWRRGIACLLLIFLAGCAAPQFLDARLIFNLHLLRSEGVLTATSLIVQSMAFVAIMSGASSRLHKFLAIQVAIGTFVLPHSLFFALASTLLFLGHAPAIRSFLARWHDKLGGERPRLLSMASIAMIAIATVVISLAAYRGSVSLVRADNDLDPGWRAMAEAIKREGGSGPYLAPLGDEADLFVALAERRLWVSWKEGAAVMWYPGFYAQWSSRWKALRELHSPEQLLAYAKAHGIPEVILKDPAQACGDGYKPRLKTDGYLWCSSSS
ncbi:hypothetical protein [Variovorax saccharolyticus]|uniref:hypothetical protein n=1 Tax=Variovorax saccharolyticus TaxID=3053516 RepID=UPI00257820E1|nr:hypothetical protein [Variovorax sp. J31P216]MDM0026850.1 hypothetical protein [Variovorax sp. J31P216]